jgi:hypothetical protein
VRGRQVRLALLVLLGQGLGVDRPELLVLRVLRVPRERPLLELRLPVTAQQEEDVRPLRRRLRACLVPSSWWSTNRNRTAYDSTSLDSSGERNRVPAAVQTPSTAKATRIGVAAAQ